MHLLVIFAIALLIFGPKKLPELGKGIGEGIRALKSGMKDASNEPPATQTPPTTATNANVANPPSAPTSVPDPDVKG
jgi:sec-independent protein translocase protein TatA